MVLPAPAPDDSAAPQAVVWIDELKLGLRLSRAGVLLLVDHARPERLGELVRALAVDFPEIDVSDEVRAALTALEGSVLILLPEARDADWLNLARPVFAQRKLKVVLFCEHATSIAIAEHAPDFYDWIAQHCECPPGPVPHAVLGLRAASAAGVPVVWRGRGDTAGIERVRSAFSAAFPGQALRWIDPRCRGAQMIAEVRAARDAWVACIPRYAVHLRRFGWALRGGGRKDRALVVTDTLPCSGYRPVHDRMMPFADARRALEEAGASRAGTLAALTGLNPEAVERARALLGKGVSEKQLVEVLSRAKDPLEALESRGEEHLDEGAALAATEGEALDLEGALYRAVWKAHAVVLGEQGQTTEALQTLDEALVFEERIEGIEHEGFTALIALVADVLARTGRAPSAEALLRKLLGPEASLPGDGPSPPAKLGPTGLSSEAHEALALFLAQPGTPALEASEHVKALRLLAVALLVQGRYEEAELFAERARARAEALPPEHQERWRTLTTLGQILAVQGRTDAALDALRHAVERVDRYSGEKHADRARTLGELARVEQRAGKPEAAATAKRALELYAASGCSDEEKRDAEQALRPIATGTRRDAASVG